LAILGGEPYTGTIKAIKDFVIEKQAPKTLGPGFMSVSNSENRGGTWSDSGLMIIFMERRFEF